MGGKGSTPYIAMEIHYDNPQLKTDMLDSSGVSIQIVRKKPGVTTEQLAEPVLDRFFRSNFEDLMGAGLPQLS